ncbi:MAG: aspartate kinase, partial [Actinobacteria bacterium]|nr:aspartate kinase [Actinomycetota bacterium]
MSLIVAKFGGTSVGSIERIKQVADRLVAMQQAGNEVVAVVSAMGSSTDELLALAKAVNDNPPAREMDMLLSTGEQVSMSILAMAIAAKGADAVSFTGAQVGMITDGVHTKAKIREVKAERIRRALSKGKIVVVAGFQGVTRDGDITTLGRGGSDTTAVALAAGINADVCEIYTDVSGVYSADPRMVPRARKLDFISYEEMLELSASGAGVLQMRSVEFARNYKVPIHCRSTFTNDPGTIIKEADEEMESAVISGIAHDSSEAKITIRGVPDRVGIAAQVFAAMAEKNINVDMIIQNISMDGYADISFTSPIADIARVKEACEEVKSTLGAKEVLVDESIAKVSIVGTGMKSNPGVAAKMFKTLADNGINISMISTSTIRTSVVIEGERLQDALRC